MKHDVDYFRKLSAEEKSFLFKVLNQLRDETGNRRRRDVYYCAKLISFEGLVSDRGKESNAS